MAAGSAPAEIAGKAYRAKSCPRRTLVRARRRGYAARPREILAPLGARADALTFRRIDWRSHESASISLSSADRSARWPSALPPRSPFLSPAASMTPKRPPLSFARSPHFSRSSGAVGWKRARPSSSLARPAPRADDGAARLLGAGRIVAAGRNQQALAALGADATVDLTLPKEELRKPSPAKPRSESTSSSISSGARRRRR